MQTVTVGAFSLPSIPQGLKNFASDVTKRATKIAAEDTASYLTRRAGNIITGKKTVAPSVTAPPYTPPSFSPFNYPIPSPRIEPVKEDKTKTYLIMGAVAVGALAIGMFAKR